MKFSILAIAAALAQPSLAFQSNSFARYHSRHTFLAASTFSKTGEAAAAAADPGPPRPNNSLQSVSDNHNNQQNGRSSEEIEAELSSGKVLEGGKVIDFESVKGPSRAEQALLEARQLVLSKGAAATTSAGMLGINSDVISEVGHELGKFASARDVQKCASYLRSQAPAGLLKDNTEEPVVFDEKDKVIFQKIMDKAYEESGEVTGAFAKTFYMGTMLLPEEAREAIWAVYVWCRRTDEIVDAPREDDQEMLNDLSSWEMRLEKLWDEGAVVDVYDLCLLDIRVKYPNMSITPYMDMIRGMLMDVPELGQDRYDTFDELH